MKTIGVAIVGAGGIALQNHLPGFALMPQCKVVALCDSNPATLEKAKQATGIPVADADYTKIVTRDDVHAVVIATPNHLHAPIAHAAIKAGKHVLCEKPIAMNYQEAMGMYRAAEAAGVRHMTAFTYRFVPGFRYMHHLVKQGYIGRPYHFRCQRFQDWGDRFLGWRQMKKFCATGEMGDMLSHRIDLGHLLVGPIDRLVARTKMLVDTRGGEPADVEDWVGILADYKNGTTGVMESTKIATGRGEGARSRDYLEVNGSEGTLVIHGQENPLEIQMGKKGDPTLKTVRIPDEFLKTELSPRDPKAGDPLFTFRYDQSVEFIDAIIKERPCSATFLDGAKVEAVMEAALLSQETRCWIPVEEK